MPACTCQFHRDRTHPSVCHAWKNLSFIGTGAQGGKKLAARLVVTSATAEDTSTASEDGEKVGDVSIAAAAPVVPKVCDVIMHIAMVHHCKTQQSPHCLDLECTGDYARIGLVIDCAVTAGCTGHCDAVLLPT